MSFAHFLIVLLLLNFVNFLYILDTSPLSNIWLANIFSPVYNLSFHPLHMSFYGTNVFNFDEVYCILPFMTFDVKSKNTLPSLRS